MHIKPKWKYIISQTGSKAVKKALKTRFWSGNDYFAFRTVMLDRGGVELICSILKPDMDVLEYGSGGSTTFFRWAEASDNNLSYVAEASDRLILLSANLWKAGQAWSMIATGNQRYLNFKSEAWFWYFWRWKTPWRCYHGGKRWPTTLSK